MPVTENCTEPEYHFRFDLSETGVRAALADILRNIAILGVPCGFYGSIELVLAEVFNNIEEHAYPENAGKDVDVTYALGQNRLDFTVIDHGFPLPGGKLPTGVPADLTKNTLDLPEGGFGWFLIHSTATNIRYLRLDGCNILKFTLAL